MVSACSMTLRASGEASLRASLMRTASGVLRACARLPTCVRERSTISWLDLRSALSSCCRGLISDGSRPSRRAACARADGGEPLLHPRQREEAEADLEQRGGEQADAGERERLDELGAEGGQVVLHLAQPAGHGNRIALRRLARAELVDHLGDAHRLLGGTRRDRPSGPPCRWARCRARSAGADRRRQASASAASRPACRQRLDLPVPARVRVWANRPSPQ